MSGTLRESDSMRCDCAHGNLVYRAAAGQSEKAATGPGILQAGRSTTTRQGVSASRSEILEMRRQQFCSVLASDCASSSPHLQAFPESIRGSPHP